MRELPPFFDHRYRAAYSKIETTNNLSDIEHPSVREVFKKYGQKKSLEVTHIGDLPSRSGIGSSSSFTVGLIHSVSAINGHFLGRTELARSAIKLEQNQMGENVGIQDQCAAAFGNLVYIEASKDCINPRKFISSVDYVKYIEENLLLGFDGIQRFSGDTSKKVVKGLKSGSYDFDLRELADISDAGIKAFDNEEDISTHATLTKKSRDIKRLINGDHMSTRDNELIEATENAGSLCTRIIGAGGGGFFTCWAPKQKHDAIKASVNVKTWVDVRFSSTGSQVIFSE